VKDVAMNEQQVKVIEAWPNSEAAYRRARKSLGGGVSTGLRAGAHPHPIFFELGHGSKLRDVDGNEYIDYVLGWGPNILGHGHPRLVDAVSTQIQYGATYGSGHRFEYEAAELLLSAYPQLERVLWSNTGTEADLTALRLARAATGRQHFVRFRGHYHGWADQMLVGYRPRPGDADTRGQQDDVDDYVHVVPWGDAEALSDVLSRRGDIAAVFLEPILVNSGVIAPPPGFLETVRDLCDLHGVVLIFDEVITGFRVALGGAVERFGVIPDLVVLAKAIAGGVTLSAIVGKAPLIDQVTTGTTHAGTYNGNPIALAAACATIAELSEPGTFDRLEAAGARLADGLRQALRGTGAVGAVNQVGPIVQCGLGVAEIRTFEDFLQTDAEAYDRLLVELLRRGVFSLPGGRWYLSTAHSHEDIDRTIEAFESALGAIRD
jgi:glutamate-1-semialdehyde 2,1-aminomutase